KFNIDNHLDRFNTQSGYDAINKLWGLIQQGITSAAKKHLSGSQYKKAIRNPKPDYLVEAYSHLRISSRSVMKFSSKHMRNHTLSSPTSWTLIILPQIIQAASYIEYDHSTIPTLLNEDTSVAIRHHLTE